MLFQKISSDRVQHAIKKVNGLGRSITPRYLERLVDDDCGRSVRIAEHLSHSRAYEVAIHYSHALQTPILGVCLDQLVDLGLPRSRHAIDIFGKRSSVVI